MYITLYNEQLKINGKNIEELKTNKNMISLIQPIDGLNNIQYFI